MASPPGLFAHELAELDIPGLARSAREAGPAEVDAVLRRAA
ncbi:hypothetical protein FrEUN1fDRAFT_8124, partial [Parafrankia sp. EUN1f]